MIGMQQSRTLESLAGFTVPWFILADHFQMVGFAIQMGLMSIYTLFMIS